MRIRALRGGACRRAFALAAASLWLCIAPSARAQDEAGLPATSIAPEGEAPPLPPPVSSPPHPATHHVTPPAPAHHVLASKTPPTVAKPVLVEPANARLRLKQDTWIYAEPSNKSARVEPGQQGKFVVVTGSTRYFLRVKLKNGQEGYVPANAVALTSPADKLFLLTRDAPVLDAPNRWGKKLSEVHHGHAVHVVGIALGYLKIRMKSGLEGYIPSTALE
jgi:hypothetical protein